MKITYCFLLLCVVASNAADIIPADRVVDWKQAGIPGGIPSRSVVTNITGLDGTGSADVSAALEAILQAAVGGVAVLPEGRFKLSSQVDLPSNVTLRGSGSNTVLLVESGYGLVATWPRWYDEQRLISGATKGASNVTMSSAVSDLAVGYVVMIDETNDPAAGVFPLGIDGTSGESARGQLAQVTAVDGVSVTFWPPLSFTYTNSPRIKFPVQYGQSVNMATGIGIENLVVSNAVGGVNDTLIVWTGVKHSWIKDVTLRSISRSGFWMEFCFQNEITRLWVQGVAGTLSSGRLYGVLFGGGPPSLKCSWNILQDSVFTEVRGPIIGYGSHGNVIAYNFFTNLFQDQEWNAKMAISVHSSHPAMNLFEGNVGKKFNADFFHGSSSHQTLFRNHWYGREPRDTGAQVGIEVDASNRVYSAVGNVIGYAGITNDETCVFEEAVPDASDYGKFRVWQLGYDGEGGSQTMADPGVESSLYRHGNFDWVTVSTNWADGYSQTLPASLYLAAAPIWWGTNGWPAIGPDVSGYVKPIPAEVRYLTGEGGSETSSGIGGATISGTATLTGGATLKTL